MTETPILKTMLDGIQGLDFLDFEFTWFLFVSDFDIRISDFV